MKRFSLFSLFLIAGLVLAPAAFAEMIQGSVNNVDPDGKTISVLRTDEPGKSDEVRVSVNEETQFNGIQSVAELTPGDQVVVDADQNFFTRAWKANSLERSQGGVNQADMADAAADTTADTMDTTTADTSVSTASETAADDTRPSDPASDELSETAAETNADAEVVTTADSSAVAGTADVTSPTSAAERTDAFEATPADEAVVASGTAANTTTLDADAVPSANFEDQTAAMPNQGVTDEPANQSSTGASGSAETNDARVGDASVN